MPDSFLSNYFGFNRQQRNGLAVLVTISFVLLVVRVAYPYFIQPDKIVIKNLPLYEKKIDSAFSGEEWKREGWKGEKGKMESGKMENGGKEEGSMEKGALFVFDPNTVSFDQLLKLGFKEKAAKRFIKFRSKGFVFKTKKDVLKLYGISENFYARLEPYILIGDKKARQATIKNEPQQTQQVTKQNRQGSKIELNTADSLTLVGVNGIGPVYARRILKYRSLLGGFVSVEQLKEVYGFTEEAYGKVSGFFTADAALVTRIDLNKDSFKAINRHPYLTYEMTKSICDWRRKTSITATTLKDIISDEALYRKLLPYLAFQ